MKNKNVILSAAKNLFTLRGTLALGARIRARKTFTERFSILSGAKNRFLPSDDID